MNGRKIQNMKAYSKICHVVLNILKWVVAILMVFMVILTFVEVIRRYFFHQNWVWSEVLVRYLIVWCTFLGGAAAYRVGALTNFDLVTQKLGRRTQLALELLCTVVILLLAVWLTKLGIDSFLRPSIANQISVELHISVKWIYLGIPAGLAAMALFAVEKLLKLIRELKNAGSSKEVEQA